MRSRAWRKLHSTLGESIGETLVALLVSTLGIMLLAGMIVASTRLIMQSEETLSKYYTANNIISAQDIGDTKGQLKITIADKSVSRHFYDIVIEDVNCYTNTEIGNTPIVSYSRP